MWHRERRIMLNVSYQIWDSLPNNKMNALRADQFRPSVRPYRCQIPSVSKQTFRWIFEIWCTCSLQRASERAWVWRLWTLVRAFSCNEMESETLSHFGSKESLRKATNCTVSSSVPEHLHSIQRCGLQGRGSVPGRGTFLGTFAKFQKATISFVISVCLSPWNNWADNGRIFIKFNILGFFQNLSRKFKFH